MSDFFKLCHQNKISIITQLQKKQTSDDYKSDVWLVRDNDNLFKVFKSLTDYSHLSGYLNEDQLDLPNLSFLPRYYGITVLGHQKYLRHSFVYGQLLSNYCYSKNTLPKDTVFSIINNLALKLIILQKHLDILFLDLRPENVLITSDTVKLFDLGLSRHTLNDDFFKPVVSHPRFTAPEIVRDSLANSKSIVFQLGLLAHELLYGRHPFDSEPNSNLDWHYGVKQYIEPYLNGTELNVKDDRIKRMLSYSIDDRPTLSEYVGEFTISNFFIHRKNVWTSNSKSVLFPARMAIPHKGHINFITTLLDMGFKLIISIQRAYTLTRKDPIPKWLISQMVKETLFELGYPEESFKIYLTPFYKTTKELQLHFSMLPDSYDFVASSNPSIINFFGKNTIQQKDVLSFENQKYTDKSWGEILRSAININDYQLFKKYAAIGVEKILTFEKIKEQSSNITENFFVYSNNVFVNLYDFNNNLIFSTKVSRYSTPEKCLKNFSNFFYKDLKYEQNNCIISYQLYQEES